jgi:ribosomal-protein-alanine N-acetyltransferase
VRTNAEDARIRPMGAEDLLRVIEIERELKDAPQWSRKAWEDAVDPQAARRRIAIVAEEPETGTVQGFAAASLAGLEAELESIGVAPEWQRRGLARRIFGMLADELRRAGVQEVFLEVRVSNRAAIGAYRAFGFEPSGRRPRYYAEPEEDAVLMLLRLG